MNTDLSSQYLNRGDVVAPQDMWWLIWRCGGSFRDVVAHLEMWWLLGRCGGSFGDVVADRDVVAHIWRFGGSLVAHQTVEAAVLG